MALQGPIEGVLCNISKHFIVQFVHRAVGYSVCQRCQVRETGNSQVKGSSQGGDTCHINHKQTVLQSCQLKCNDIVNLTFICNTCAALQVPVYGDVFQEFIGQAVVQDDPLRGNLESNLLRLLPTGFSLLQKQKRSLFYCMLMC